MEAFEYQTFPAAAVTDAPRAADLVRALGGFAWLGVTATLGGEADAGLGAPVALASGAGVLLLTVPALLVAHQFAGLSAPPSALVGAIAKVFCRAGDLALAAVPPVLFFSATSARGGVVAAAIVVGIAAIGLSRCAALLLRAEADADGTGLPRMRALLLGWALLAGLVGLRLFSYFAPHLV